MQKCGKPIGLAKNGVDRGVCNRPAGHKGRNHGNGTCNMCGEKLTSKNASPSVVKYGSGTCRICITENNRNEHGHNAMNRQTPGKLHTFPCGCSGTLPKQGESSAFVVWFSPSYSCRVSRILRSSAREAREGGHVSINQDTPHSVIRQMMLNTECTVCGEKLDWTRLGYGKTPHLDHDHATGTILGFTHPKCNPLALQIRVRKLEEENKQLKQQLELAALKMAA